MRALLFCSLALLVACSSREDRARQEARTVVAAFDAVMDARPGQRAPRVEALRALMPTDARARDARERCLRLFDAIAHASSLQDRLEPMADRLDAYADGGTPIPAEQRNEVLRLYREATAATDEASTALAPCTEAIDRLRVHRARRR